MTPTAHPDLPSPDRASSRKLPLDDDALLARGLDAFRDDCARSPAPGLAVRVLGDVRRGDAESARFVRVARAYAVAAAVLLVVGVGGSVITRRGAHGGSRSALGPIPGIADLEENRLARELAVTLDDHPVGGK